MTQAQFRFRSSHLRFCAGSFLALMAVSPLSPASAAEPNVPVLVPITGFLAVEGRSQRNGAVLALTHAPGNMKVGHEVSDTGTSPEVAVNAYERAVGQPGTLAVVAPMLGTQMLALLPVAMQAKVPMLTMSGTAAVTQKNNPYVFRFFPDDSIAKAAQVSYALDTLKVKHPAVIYQTTAYGQSGHTEIMRLLKEHNVKAVYEDGLDVSQKDMAPVIAKAKAAGADSLLLQLHGGPTALFIKAAAREGLTLPIVAGSGLSQPSTLALLDPSDLTHACAETGSSPLSGETPEMRKFVEEYKAAFHQDPDGFALGQYDGTMMALHAIANGADTPAKVTKALSTTSYKGLAMTYRSNGHGDMAHSSVIICFDGKSRIPKVMKHYDAK